MLPKTKDRFEEWLRMPLPREAGDPRFEIRRAPPWEFERIYDLVDATFGVARPRVLYGHFLWVDHSFLPAPPCLRDWQLMPGDHDDR
jgi:hypothetical protein